MRSEIERRRESKRAAFAADGAWWRLATLSERVVDVRSDRLGMWNNVTNNERLAVRRKAALAARMEAKP